MKQPTIASSCIAFLVLFICFILLISGVHALTSPRVAAFELMQRQRAEKQSRATQILKPLFPEATGFIKLGTTAFHDSSADYYRAENGSTVAGYAIHAFGKGYQNMIHAIVGVNPDFSIRSVNIISQAETEGLGARMLEEPFLKQFVGKNGRRLRVITQGDSSDAITAISAATISSKALTEDAIKKAVIFLEKQVQK
jgi:electron transport complex protein RnfG